MTASPHPVASSAERLETADIAAHIRAGDVTAFEAVFRTYYEPLVAFVERMVGDAAAAEDVVQALFVRVWDARQTFALHGSVSAYLYAAAQHGARRRMKRRHLDEAIVAETRYTAASFAEPADATVRQREAAKAVADAIAELSPRCREVFVLTRGHGLSRVEIARALGISTRAVDQQLWRAMVVLRKRLGWLLPALLVAAATAEQTWPASHPDMSRISWAPARAYLSGDERPRVGARL